jgi:uncharacterized protein YjdB
MGEVWVSLNDQGLYRSGDAGSTFNKIANVQTAFMFSFGQHAPSRLNPAVFVYGKVVGYDKEAVFRSDDMGQSWVKISLDNPFPGNDPNAMVGDRQVHGRIYIGTNGTGLLYGAKAVPASAPEYNDTDRPSAPTHLSVSGTRRTSVDLKWEQAADSGSGVKGYRIAFGDGTFIADTYGTSYSVSGLMPDTVYTFKVQALDMAGNASVYSNAADASTASIDMTPPAAPGQLRATSAAAYRVMLEWSPNPESDFMGYNLYRSTTSGFAATEANKIATLLTNSNYADWNQIKEESTYYYKLESVDIANNKSALSDEIMVRTTADNRLDLIVDNLDAGFTSDSPWTASTFSGSRFGANYFHDGNSKGRWAKWTPYITVAGEYNVYMLWNASSSRTYSASLEINYDNGKDAAKTVNQTLNDNMWVWIGKYSFAEGNSGYLKLTTKGDNTAIADAVKFTLASTDAYGTTHAQGGASADTKAPVIKLDAANGSVQAAVYTLSGRTDEAVAIKIRNNGIAVTTPYNSNYTNVFRIAVPLKEGANSIVLEATDRTGNKSTASLTLDATIPVGVSNVVLSTYGVPSTVQPGDAYRLTASLTPANATNKNIRFSTSDATVATVTDGTYNPQDGTTSALITAVGAGTATVTSTSEDGGYSDSYIFTVTAPSDTTAPGEVMNAHVTSLNGQLKLTWTDPVDSDLAQIRIGGSGTTVLDAVYANKGAGTVTLAGLSNGILYSLKITAWDTSGNESAGIIVSGMPTQPTDTGGNEGGTSSGSDGLPSSQQPQTQQAPHTESVDRHRVKTEAVADSNGTASVTVGAQSLETAMKQAQDRTITIEVQAREAREVKVNVPLLPLITGASGVIDSIKVDVGFASVSISKDVISQSDGSPDMLLLTIAKADPEQLPQEARDKLKGGELYEFELIVNGHQVTGFNGSNEVVVEVGYSLKTGENPGKVVVYYVNGNGNLEIVKNGRYDPLAKTVRFAPKRFSKYTAAYGHAAFQDIGQHAWATDSIEALAARGAIQGVGDGLFNPGGEVTRAEFITMLMNAFDLADREATSTLNDVEQGIWYYSAVAGAQKLGVVNGKEDGAFGVNDHITRQDMAVMAYRLIEILHAALPMDQSVSVFADRADIAGYAAEAVAVMQQAGLLNGLDNGSFAPLGVATRAQAAVVIYRLLLSTL